MDQQIPVALGSASVYDNPNSTEMEVLMGSVIKCWGPALPKTPWLIKGEYLKSFDPEAHDGRGEALFTPDIKQAKVFHDQLAALTEWQRQSETRPLRDDGRPNRPLTSFSCSFENI